MTSLILPTLLLACGGGTTGGTTGDTTNADAGATDGGSTDAGSTAGTASLDILDISAEVSPDVVTVARVSWSTDTETTGTISFGETDAYGLTTPISDLGTDHQQLLLGMPADTVIHYQIHVSDGALEGTSGDQTLTTGSLPSGMPTMALVTTTATLELVRP